MQELKIVFIMGIQRKLDAKGIKDSQNFRQGGSHVSHCLPQGDVDNCICLLLPWLPKRATLPLLSAYQSICRISYHPLRASNPKAVGWKNSHNRKTLASLRRRWCVKLFHRAPDNYWKGKSLQSWYSCSL